MVRLFYAATTALLAATFVAGAEATYNTFIGCASSPASGSYQLGGIRYYSLAACTDLCQAANVAFCWSYEVAGTGEGYCYAAGPNGILYANQLRGDTPASRRCNNGWTTLAMGTTFQMLPNCYNKPSAKDGPYADTMQECYGMCRNNIYALIQADFPSGGNNLKYTCTCTDTLPANLSPAGDCGYDTIYAYSHTPTAAASGLARRKEAARYLRQQEVLAANPHCPPSLAACNVLPNGQGGFECLDPEHELESCGGCRYGGYGSAGNSTAVGRDCTQIYGVHPRGGAMCQSGVCRVLRCRKNFKLANGACVRHY